jgi:cytochrome b involved in lipid metabolism
MSKGNPQKKVVWQDNFIKHWCKSSDNHPEGWHWWKKRVRKDFRRKMKNQLHNEVINMED